MSTEDAAHAHRKALELNLDDSIFGSFAEIGAGQEVARWFFQVGAASGTVAKTICAYDKAVSDDLYGAGERYVSRPRLEAMLDAEWDALRTQVGDERRASAKLFAFADTAAARNYHGTNVCHAWLGLQFQRRPGGEASRVVVHANLLDPTNQLQCEALGLLGVNLIHAVHHAADDRETFAAALFDGLTLDRLEIDLLAPTGPAFDGWALDQLHASLITERLATGVVFTEARGHAAPAEALYKRPLVLAPGHFQDVGEIHAKVIAAANAALRDELGPDGRDPLGLFALTDIGPDLEESIGSRAPQVCDRVAALLERGGGVLVMRERELFNTAAFVERYTSRPVRFAVSTGVLMRVLQDAHNQALGGQVLEAVSRLFQRNVKLYVFPSRGDAVPTALRASLPDAPTGLVGAADVRPPGPLAHLYDYLLEAGFVVPMAPVAS